RYAAQNTQKNLKFPLPPVGEGGQGDGGEVHNGIEYGLMQAYAEGLELMQHKTEFRLNLHQITEIWRHGSVVRSWLLDLTAKALAENPTLDGIAAYVTDSGEGRWTVAEAIELGVAIPVISMALQRRFRSREQAPFSDKLLAAMRRQFGGHAVKKDQGEAAPMSQIDSNPKSITLVIFGASGDLTQRKLIPALFSLHRKGRLPASTRIVGFAYAPAFSHQEFRAHLKEGVEKYAGRIFDAAAWDEFAVRCNL
ncbi:MAG: hypothetical protein AB1801_14205, partial [Chloroflexota bacterium]